MHAFHMGILPHIHRYIDVALNMSFMHGFSYLPWVIRIGLNTLDLRFFLGGWPGMSDLTSQEVKTEAFEAFRISVP